MVPIIWFLLIGTAFTARPNVDPKLIETGDCIDKVEGKIKTAHKDLWTLNGVKNLYDKLPGNRILFNPSIANRLFLEKYKKQTSEGNFPTATQDGIVSLSILTIRNNMTYFGVYDSCYDADQGGQNYCMGRDKQTCCLSQCKDTEEIEVSSNVALKCNFRNPVTEGVLNSGKLENHKIIKNLDQDLCSIQDVIIKDCPYTYSTEEDIPFVLLGDIIQPVKSLNLITRENAQETTCYKCNGKAGVCATNPCATSSCKGDQYYKENFSGVLSADCTCTYNTNCTSVFLLDGHINIPISCWGFIRAPVTRKRYDVPSSATTKDCDQCVLECTEDGMKFNTRGTKIAHFLVCGNTGCVSGETKHSNAFEEIPLTKEMKAAGGFFSLSYWHETGEKGSAHVQCPPVDICKLLACTWCIENLYNYHCWNAGHWMALILAVFFSLLLIYIVLSIITKMLWLICMLFKPFRICCLRLRGCCKRNGYRVANAYGEFMDFEGTAREGDLEMNTIRSTSMPSIPTRPNRRLLTLGICLGLISIVSGCAKSTTLSATTSDCTIQENGREVCKITQEMRLGLAPIGQDTCLIIKGADNKPLANMVINIKSVSILCNKESLYFTRQVVASCQSQYNCRSVGDCHDEYCEFVNSDTSIYWDESNDLPGKFSCSRKEGCAGNGCGLCAPACLFKFVGIMPDPKTSDVYEAFKCPTWKYHIEASIQWVTTIDTSTKIVKLVPGSTESVFGVDITLVSISSPPQPILGKCFLKQGESFYLADCSPKGDTIPGQIGEIQCPTIESAKSVKKTCFYAETLVNVNEHVQSLSCTSKFQNINAGVKDFKLPKLFSELFLYPEKGEILAQFKGNALLELQLSMNGKTVVAQSDNNFCYARQISLTGCYNCITGAILQIETNTNFGTAIGQLNCPSLGVSTSLHFKEIVEKKNVSIHFSQSDISIDCDISCPAGITKTTLKGTLKYMEVSDNRDETFVTTTGNNNSGGSVSWGSIFSLDWLGSYKWYIIAIVIIFIIIIIIIIVKKLIMSKSS